MKVAEPCKSVLDLGLIFNGVTESECPCEPGHQQKKHGKSEDPDQMAVEAN